MPLSVRHEGLDNVFVTVVVSKSEFLTLLSAFLSLSDANGASIVRCICLFSLFSIKLQRVLIALRVVI